MAHKAATLPALGAVNRRRLPEATQMAWWAELTRWTDGLRRSYIYLWPDKPEGAVDPNLRLRKRAWPNCWRNHSGLVEDLVALKTWQEGLLHGEEWAGGPRGWCEWRAFLDSFAAQIQNVAQACSFRHGTWEERQENAG